MQRIGLHYGECVSGVLGNNVPQYTVIGDSINFTARLEETAHENSIQCSAEAARTLRAAGFGLLRRAKRTQLKGFAEPVQTWFVTRGPLHAEDVASFDADAYDDSVGNSAPPGAKVGHLSRATSKAESESGTIEKSASRKRRKRAKN